MGDRSRSFEGVFLPHRLPGPLLPGTLVARPNRFLTIVRLAGGLEVEAHVGDRGRLEGILVPGAEVHVARAPAGPRRTAYTLLCARCPPLSSSLVGPLSCLDPAGANRLLRALLDAGVLPLPRARAIRPEVRVGASRFDFELSLARGGRMIVEVKSVGVAEGRAALFPDAPSERAARHCRELAELARAGERTAIVLVAQRADVAEIRPHPVDPEFAHALAEARRAGVKVIGTAFEVGLDGFRWAGPRPVRVRAPLR